jgi:deoxyadenosine/deoxycytidine kinase
MNNKPIIISIEGNIGSGKSTMLKHIRENFKNWNFIDEPVDSWLSLKDENGTSLLELFYTDKKRWSYTFQNSAFITRFTSMMNAIRKWESSSLDEDKKSNIFISERCVLTDRYVFAEMLKESNCLNPLEWELYTKWFDWFASTTPIDGLIYVNTGYNVCNDRIKWRGRKGEESIPLDYLSSLQIQHEKWIQNEITKRPVLHISSDVTELNKISEWITSLN